MFVGFIGKKYAGKTTSANMWAEAKPSMLFSFGDQLKEMLVDAQLLTKEEAWVTKPPHARNLLQKIGTNLIRNQIDEDFWVHKLGMKFRELDVVYEHTKNNKDILIHDVRFTNEAAYVKRFGGILIRVCRTVGEQGDGDRHRSEVEQDRIAADYTIFNISTLEDLRESIGKLIYSLQKP